MLFIIIICEIQEKKGIHKLRTYSFNKYFILLKDIISS